MSQRFRSQGGDHARAFINKPDVLFLDEPTGALAPATAAAIRTTIRQEADRGVAVLLTTHDMFEADQLSDRIAFINNARSSPWTSRELEAQVRHTRSVKVRLRDGDGVREENLPLDDDAASTRLAELVASPDLLTMHTEEATLEHIFTGSA